MLGKGLEHPDVAVGQEHDVEGRPELARALPLPADRAQKLAVRSVDLDLVELGVQHVEVAVAVGDDVGDHPEQHVLVVVTTDPPEFLQLEGLRTLGGLAGIHDLLLTHSWRRDKVMNSDCKDQRQNLYRLGTESIGHQAAPPGSSQF